MWAEPVGDTTQDLFLHNEDIGAAADTLYRRVEVTFLYSRDTGCTYEFSLRRALRDGNGAEATVVTAANLVTAAFATRTTPWNHDVDPLYQYKLRWRIQSDGARTDAGVASFDLHIKKRAVE